MGILALLFTRDVIKVTTTGVLITAMIVTLTSSVSNLLAQFVMPDSMIKLWNFFEMGRCLDVVISGYITRWTITVSKMVIKSMTS